MEQLPEKPARTLRTGLSYHTPGMVFGVLGRRETKHGFGLEEFVDAFHAPLAAIA